MLLRIKRSLKIPDYEPKVLEGFLIIEYTSSQVNLMIIKLKASDFGILFDGIKISNKPLTHIEIRKK